MKGHVRSLALATLVLTLATPATAQIDLKQGWSAEQSDQFWFTSQGSCLLPYTWFLNLEQAASAAKFRDPCNMRRLGYIPAGKSGRPTRFSDCSPQAEPDG